MCPFVFPHSQFLPFLHPARDGGGRVGESVMEGGGGRLCPAQGQASVGRGRRDGGVARPGTAPAPRPPIKPSTYCRASATCCSVGLTLPSGSGGERGVRLQSGKGVQAKGNICGQNNRICNKQLPYVLSHTVHVLINDITILTLQKQSTILTRLSHIQSYFIFIYKCRVTSDLIITVRYYV